MKTYFYVLNFVSQDCHTDVCFKLMRSLRTNRSESKVEILLRMLCWRYYIHQNEVSSTNECSLEYHCTETTLNLVQKWSPS